MSEAHVDFFQKANQAQFDLLLDQLKNVDEWMSKDFPEIDFKVKVDSHMDAKTLTVLLTFLTAGEMSENDKLFKKLELKWDEETWNNPKTLTSLIQLNERLKTTISRTINEWYKTRKEKDEHGVT